MNEILALHIASCFSESAQKQNHHFTSCWLVVSDHPRKTYNCGMQTLMYSVSHLLANVMWVNYTAKILYRILGLPTGANFDLSFSMGGCCDFTWLTLLICQGQNPTHNSLLLLSGSVQWLHSVFVFPVWQIVGMRFLSFGIVCPVLANHKEWAVYNTVWSKDICIICVKSLDSWFDPVNVRMYLW